MFTKHSLRINLVKDPKTTTATEGPTNVIVINNPPKLMRNLALTAGSLYTLKALVDTSASIALIIASKK
jgi:hypothetical protein